MDRPHTAADLAPLIRRLRALHETGRDWRIGATEAASLLGVPEMEMIRLVYEASLRPGAVVSVGTATDVFGPEQGPELLALVELLAGTGAERALYVAGIHLPHEERVELVRVFLERAASSVGRHVVDAHKLSAMLRVHRGWQAAERTYLAELPSLDSLVQEAAARYCAGRSFEIPGLAASTAERILRLFFRRKILDPEAVYGRVREQIRAQATREGYRVAEERRRRPVWESVEVEDPLRDARRCMELDGRTLTPQILRSQYRKLMKRYHPDVNPQGLERCQAINAAYSVLSELVGE